MNLDLIHALDRKLHELAANERAGLVEFLKALDAFDREKGWARLARPRLWDYLTLELHYSEATASRRQRAMLLLREHPELEAPIADGRIGLTVLSILGKVITRENVGEIVRRAVHLSMRQAEEFVVEFQPRGVRADGMRKVPEPAAAAPAPAGNPAPTSATPKLALVPPVGAPAPAEPAPEPARERVPLWRALRPVARSRWTMQFTLDEELKAGTERLQALLSHRIPDGDVTAMYRFMLEAGIEKVGKQVGAVAPLRPRTPEPPVERPRGERDPIPAAVKREVWARDGGQCTQVGPNGRRCESRWQLEFHHPGLAWKTGSTAKDVTLRCKPHNHLEAEDVYGKELVEARIAEKKKHGSGEG